MCCLNVFVSVSRLCSGLVLMVVVYIVCSLFGGLGNMMISGLCVGIRNLGVVFIGFSIVVFVGVNVCLCVFFCSVVFDVLVKCCWMFIICV